MKELSADFAIDALAAEASRRRKKMDRPYSYGQLVADTTIEQRRVIAEKYRRRKKREAGT